MFITQQSKPVFITEQSKPMFITRLFNDKYWFRLFSEKHWFRLFNDKYWFRLFSDKHWFRLFSDKHWFRPEQSQPMFIIEQSQPMFIIEQSKPMFIIEQSQPIFIIEKYLKWSLDFTSDSTSPQSICSFSSIELDYSPEVRNSIDLNTTFRRKLSFGGDNTSVVPTNQPLNSQQQPCNDVNTCNVFYPNTIQNNQLWRYEEDSQNTLLGYKCDMKLKFAFSLKKRLLLFHSFSCVMLSSTKLMSVVSSMLLTFVTWRSSHL
jgi:hypothetical protein